MIFRTVGRVAERGLTVFDLFLLLEGGRPSECFVEEPYRVDGPDEREQGETDWNEIEF